MERDRLARSLGSSDAVIAVIAVVVIAIVVIETFEEDDNKLRRAWTFHR